MQNGRAGPDARALMIQLYGGANVDTR